MSLAQWAKPNLNSSRYLGDMSTVTKKLPLDYMNKRGYTCPLLVSTQH